MKTPSFWHADGFIPKLLEPLAQLYKCLSFLERSLRSKTKIDIPVLCIGNLVSGGAGKTPIALSIGQKLNVKHNISFLTRGYGGIEAGPIEVNPDEHSSYEVGDEALILSELGPTWVSRNRTAGAIAAKNAGFEIVIMDDGFQHTSLVKTLSFVIIDGPYGFGNGRLIPAGPLREPIYSGLKRADVIVLVGEVNPSIIELLPNDKPLLRVSLVPAEMGIPLSNNNVIGFAGIGRPTKFLETLEKMGLNIIDFVAFPDHYRFRESEIRELYEKATEVDAILVTTFKDMKRVPKNVAHLCQPIGITVVWEDDNEIQQLLDSVI
ncbi:tetraacyldisaccharide 4'-kinase [Alphaproteobacteria bacterium]|nr:tetraacyldisaccharide 4'-kinase [Alphaproteobacteria bacterium]